MNVWKGSKDHNLIGSYYLSHNLNSEGFEEQKCLDWRLVMIFFISPTASPQISVSL